MRRVTPGWRGFLVGGIGMASLYLGVEPLGRAFGDHHDFFGWGFNVLFWGSALVGLAAGVVAASASGFVGALGGWLLAGMVPAIVDGRLGIAGIVLLFSFLFPIGAALGAIVGWATSRTGHERSSIPALTTPTSAPTEDPSGDVATR